MKKKNGLKRAAMAGMAGVMAFSLIAVSGCGQKKSSDEQVVIYSNADDEAVEAMKTALDENGYKDQYIFQTFGTSELGGKLLAEGSDIEADLVTMSTFYVESAQDEKKMFKDLTFDPKTLDEYPSYTDHSTGRNHHRKYRADERKQSGYADFSERSGKE